ncbi:hypothetical protein ACLKA6_000728 [Drosophila palustris]
MMKMKNKNATLEAAAKVVVQDVDPDIWDLRWSDTFKIAYSTWPEIVEKHINCHSPKICEHNKTLKVENTIKSNLKVEGNTYPFGFTCSCQARSIWTPLSHEKRFQDKSHSRCHLIYMHLEHSEQYPVSLLSQTQQQKYIEKCWPESQINGDDDNIDRRQSNPNCNKFIQVNPLIAQQHQQQQQQHIHMQIEMAQNQPKGNKMAIALNNPAERLTSKHLQNQLAAKCCMQQGEMQRRNMEHQQHQHQQHQCDPATPIGQYTGRKLALQALRSTSGVFSPFNCHMLTATPMWQQHWQSASAKQLWALLFQPRPQNAHSGGTSAAATKLRLHSIFHIIPHAGASGSSSGGGRLWTTTHGGNSCGSSSSMALHIHMAILALTTATTTTMAHTLMQHHHHPIASAFPYAPAGRDGGEGVLLSCSNQFSMCRVHQNAVLTATGCPLGILPGSTCKHGRNYLNY